MRKELNNTILCFAFVCIISSSFVILVARNGDNLFLNEALRATQESQISDADTYKGIPVEVVGVPYSYKDICGSHAIDHVFDAAYELISTGQWSGFVNFSIDKFVASFADDGSMTIQTICSYDKTPAEGGAFYPADSCKIHKWKLEPMYHQHSGHNCSLDRYDDIAISQGKLNEMKNDTSLRRVYNVLLSCAEDMDYDYNRIGISVKFVTPTPLVGVCDDYSNLLIERLLAANINGVSDILKVSGGNHAWVTLNYRGKTLYLDATWFDKNIIGKDGVVVHTPYKDPRNMTFDNEIFTNHGYHHLPKVE